MGTIDESHTELQLQAVLTKLVSGTYFVYTGVYFLLTLTLIQFNTQQNHNYK